MIDFRYHLVSLIAVFLAVALGIVIGTTALNQPILNDLENQVTALTQDKRHLEDDNRVLQTRLDTGDAFEEAVAPALVAGSLNGRSVVLVVTGNEVQDDSLDEVSRLIGQAGGTVTGTVRLQPEYSDPATASSVQSYVTGPGLPTGVTLPETDDTGQLVAALLSQVLMRPTGGGQAPDTAALSSVLAGLSALDVLTQESPSVTPADYAVVLTSGGSPDEQADEQADERTGTLVDLALALDRRGSGAVVAGDTASDSGTGLVGVIRADPETSAAVSTVDNVDSAAGRVSTVLALTREREGTSGKYGTGEDTQPVPPVPAAAP